MTPDTATGIAPDELSNTQRERRERILVAATDLAMEGGYEGVQMRDVADRAEVALGTLYRYFPSKVQLLVNVLHQLVADMTTQITKQTVPGATAADRVLNLLGRAMKNLRREQALADAMMRALMFADASAAPDVERVSEVFTAAVTHALHGPDRPTRDEDAAVARVIENVWWAYILSWLSGRLTSRELTDELDVAVRLLVR
jgi:AcrR family transcriptional regulator